jgi:cobalt-zinc-cadmium efflux system outer membrane protein
MRLFWIPLLLTHCATSASPSTGTKGLRNDLRFIGSDRHAVALPNVAANRPVSLEQMIAFAQRQAPSIYRIAARRAQAAAAIKAASLSMPSDPQVSLAVGPRLSADGADFDLQLSVLQAIFLAGQRDSRIKAAKALGALRQAQLARERWLVARRVARAYFQALAARARLRFKREQLTFFKKLVALAKKRLETGDISKLQLELARAEVLGAQADVVEAEGARKRALVALAITAGWPAEKPPSVVGELGDVLTLPPAKTLYRRASSRRPDLAAKARQIVMAQMRLQVARKSRWPNPSVGLSYQMEGDPGGAGRRMHVAFFTLGTSLPFFAAGRRQQAAAEGAIVVAKAELAFAQARVRMRLQSALASVETRRTQLQLLGAKIMPRLRRNLQLLQRAFALGEIDLLQVLVARSRFLASQKRVLEARIAYCEARIALEAEVGRFSAAGCGRSRQKPDRSVAHKQETP